MFIERLAPVRAQALVQEQVRLPAVAPEARVVARRWFEAARRFAYLVPSLRIASLPGSCVGSAYAKRGCAAANQERGPLRPTEHCRLQRDSHSATHRGGTCPTGRDQIGRAHA